MRIVWRKPKNVPAEDTFVTFMPDNTYTSARDEGREYEAQLQLEATEQHLKYPPIFKPRA